MKDEVTRPHLNFSTILYSYATLPRNKILRISSLSSVRGNRKIRPAVLVSTTAEVRESELFDPSCRNFRKEGSARKWQNVDPQDIADSLVVEGESLALG